MICYVIVGLVNQMSYIGVSSAKIPFLGGIIWYFAVIVAILLQWLFLTLLKEKKAK